MRSVAQFYQDCLAVANQQPPLDLLLADAMGCILAEDVTAPFDHPNTNVAACDGYAVFSEDLTNASQATPVNLMVVAEINAGRSVPDPLLRGAAARIASGAPLPTGADSVVSLESTNLGTADVVVRSRTEPGQNVRQWAEDLRAGAVILGRGTRLGPPQLAALASVGRARVLVHPRPRVVILSIGDELVEPGTNALAGTVFDANGHALAAAVREAGVEAFRVPAVPDDHARLRDVIEDQLMRADLIVTTGGLSYGSGDTVREVLGGLGDVRFDRVAARPGHMLGVGTVGQERGHTAPVICLPGDPVAAQVCFEIYVRPALRKMQGWSKVNRAAVKAQVDRGWTSPLGTREFVRVRLVGSPREGYRASVAGEPDRLWISALAESNALAVIPEELVEVGPGQQVTCLLLEQ